MSRFEVRPQSYVKDILGPGGLLEREIKGYKSRPQQVALADAFAGNLLVRRAAFPKRPLFLAEAPCGTGKTYAYLVPLLYTLRATTGQQAFVSTSSISLQTQLVEKDLPLLQEVLSPYLEQSFKILLWKGVNNYLCLWKAQQLHYRPKEMIPDTFTLTEEESSYVRNAASMHYLGEKQDMDKHPAPKRLLPLLTTTSNECKHENCRYRGDCEYMRIKRLAFTHGTVTVVNHHLLSTLLNRPVLSLFEPLVVVDEAHDFLSIYRESRTSRFSQTSWEKFCTDLGKTLLINVREKNPNADLSSLFQIIEEVRSTKVVPTGFPGVFEPRKRKNTKIPSVNKPFVIQKGNPGWEMFSSMREVSRAALSKLGRGLGCRITTEWIPPSSFEGKVGCWGIDPETKEPVAHFFPESLEVGRIQAFFSATLRVGGSFDHFLKQTTELKEKRESKYLKEKHLLVRPHTFVAESPFDWGRQVLVIFPTKEAVNPELAREDYDQRIAYSAKKIMSYCEGKGTLFLCSSWATANTVAMALRDPSSGVKVQIILQGEQGREETILRFKKDISSILVGTLSLWTGIDVPGDALSILVMDKVPFRGGEDPFLEVKKNSDRDWFNNYVLSPAATLMAQGFGRLIRTTQDKGVCIVLDTRIFPQNAERKNYARAVLSTVFPEGVNFSDTLEDIPKFFAE